jgi:aspartate racemase
VEIVSEPRLGASMHLPEADDEVWAVLATTATDLAERCDVYGIACNTLNVYADRLAALGLGTRLVTMPDAVRAWATAIGIDTIGLLAARPVTTLGEWSAYTPLLATLDVETPSDVDGLHDLIDAIKADGGAASEHRARLASLAAGFTASHLVLACTELPLIADDTPYDGTFVDATDLLAAELVRCWSDLSPG